MIVRRREFLATSLSPFLMRALPLRGADLKNVRMGVSASHCLLVKDDGTVWSWGNNTDGELGHGRMGRETGSDEPAKIAGLPAAVDVDAGDNFSLALLRDGRVMAWGKNDEGQLGIAEPTRLPRLGSPMPSATSPAAVSSLREVRRIAAGSNFALALTADGVVHAWGRKDLGQMGDGVDPQAEPHRRVIRASPLPTKGLPRVREISAGHDHALAVAEDGTVWGWGTNQNGQLGAEGPLWTATPVQTPGLRDIVAVVASTRTSFALDASGRVWSWGSNSSAQLGDGTPATDQSGAGAWRRQPAIVPGLAGVAALGSGFGTGYALLGDGTVRGWGHNAYGNAGAPVSGSRLNSPPGIKNAIAISAGGYRCLALLSDGRVMGWGVVYRENLPGRPMHVRTPVPLISL